MYPESSHNGVLADMKIDEAIDQFTAASRTSQNATCHGAHAARAVGFTYLLATYS